MNTEKQRYLELADFLKTRRAKILPSQVGLPQGTRRRTPGLRREEVAQLAGIGVTWYTWLEQGRPIQVSTQILESLSQVFLLDRNERNHLFTLARQPQPVELPSYQGVINPSIQNVLDSLTLSPSFIMDQRWNVIGWNKAAGFVFGDYSKMNVRERNIVWMMFTNSEYKELFVDWEAHAQGMLARFRISCGQYIEDPWFVEFISDLKVKSKEFYLWWSRHEVQSIGEVNKKINHPIVGSIEFEFCSFDISDKPNLKLIINTPLADTDTIQKMELLFNI